MRDPALDEIAQKSIVDRGASPGAALGVAVRRGASWEVYTGAAGRRSLRDPAPVSPGTVYDLASVSKPFLAVLSAELVANGGLNWSTSLATLLPEARGRFAGDATIEMLLSHRAGLKAHLDLYSVLREQRPVRRRHLLEHAACADAQLLRQADGSFETLYSDLGYILLGAALEHLLRAPLDALVERSIAAPLSIDIRSARLWFRQRLSPYSLAPTEQQFWRGGELNGCTHDENAWALCGHGFAGHAGLFGDVEALLRFGTGLCDAYHGHPQVHASSTQVRFMVSAQPGRSHAVGFDTKSSTGPSSIGSIFGSKTFGHLGYTGTSLWCDPEAEVAVCLLTNRVNLGREPNLLRDVRPLVHDQLCLLGLSRR